MLTLTFPGLRPQAKARPRVVKGHAYMPKAYQDWRAEFADLARQQYKGAPLTGCVAVALVYRTKTGSMRPDLDNAAAAALDALQDAAVIANDRQVRRLLAEVIKSKDAGITVVVELIE